MFKLPVISLAVLRTDSKRRTAQGLRLSIRVSSQIAAALISRRGVVAALMSLALLLDANAGAAVAAPGKPPRLPPPPPSAPPPRPHGIPSVQSTPPTANLARAYPYPAGQARISGTVGAGGAIPIGATVRLAGTPYVTIVDRAGHFEFPVLPTSRANRPVFQVVAEAPGLGTHTISQVPLFDRQDIIVHFDLPARGQTKANPGFKPPTRSHQRGAGAASDTLLADTATVATADPGLMDDLSAASLFGSQPLFAVASNTTPPHIYVSGSSGTFRVRIHPHATRYRTNTLHGPITSTSMTTCGGCCHTSGTLTSTCPLYKQERLQSRTSAGTG